jgi:hypothetical protein
MRLTLLVLPLALITGCMSDSDRAAAPPPAKPQVPAATTPAAPAASATPTALPAAVASAPKPAPKPVTVELAKFVGPTESAANFGYDEGAGRLFLYSNGAIELPMKVAADGDYEFAISAACDEAMGIKAKFSLTLDGQVINPEVTLTAVEAKEYVVKAPGIKAGEHKVAIAFLNDMYKENEYDLNLYVHGVTLRPAP